MVGAVGCAAASAFVLIRSDGQPIHDWTLQPTVYLAIASAAANILLHFALAEGVNIAWWRRSLKEGTTVNDLHRCWDYGNSLWAASTSGRHFNMVALASIMAALAPINGPLLQRASTVTTQSIQRETALKVSIAPELPFGFTGVTTGRVRSVAMLSSNFTPVMRDYSNRMDINMTNTGCDGVCYSTLKGAGFAVNCSTSTVPYTLNGSLKNSSINWDAFNGTAVFTSNFTFNENNPGNILLTVSYKDSADCDGDLTIKTCLLRAGTAEYPVIYHNDTVRLNDATTISDDKVSSLSTVREQFGPGGSTLGGMALALNNKFMSTAHLRFAGAVGYDITSLGSPPNEYLMTSGFPRCSMQWADPTADLLAAAREVMFRTAIRAANSSTPQTVRATQSNIRTVYKSNYLFLGLALLVTLLGVGFVFPIFTGWWKLGRKVSLSPIETAKAFNAPLLCGHDSNGEAAALLKEVGNRPVKYGEVAILGKNILPKDVYVHPNDPNVMRRLEMASPGWVRLPQDRSRYS